MGSIVLEKLRLSEIIPVNHSTIEFSIDEFTTDFIWCS